MVQAVVHNHLGPSGNYLPVFGPYLGPGGTGWGDGLNLDAAHSDEVRRLVLDNVRFWLEDMRVDGLRLDAVHAIYDFGARHVLAELADRPLDELCDEVIARLRPEGLQDDVALVAIRLHPEDRPRPVEAGPERLPDAPP